jgi:hypothetical protein
MHDEFSRTRGVLKRASTIFQKTTHAEQPEPHSNSSRARWPHETNNNTTATHFHEASACAHAANANKRANVEKPERLKNCSSHVACNAARAGFHCVHTLCVPRNTGSAQRQTQRHAKHLKHRKQTGAKNKLSCALRVEHTPRANNNKSRNMNEFQKKTTHPTLLVVDGRRKKSLSARSIGVSDAAFVHHNEVI